MAANHESSCLVWMLSPELGCNMLLCSLAGIVEMFPYNTVGRDFSLSENSNSPQRFHKTGWEPIVGTP